MEKRASRTQQIQKSFSRMFADLPDSAATVRNTSARSRCSRAEKALATRRRLGSTADSTPHPRRHVSGSQPRESRRTQNRLDCSDGLPGYVVLAEIPESGKGRACRLARKLQPPTVRRVNHPDRDVADAKRAARRIGMKHGHGRHLCTELETSRGFRSVNLDRLAVPAGDGLNNRQDIGMDCANVGAHLGTGEDAAREALDLTVSDQPGKRPVNGAGGAVFQKPWAREGLPFR